MLLFSSDNRACLLFTDENEEEDDELDEDELDEDEPDDDGGVKFRLDALLFRLDTATTLVVTGAATKTGGVAATGVIAGVGLTFSKKLKSLRSGKSI